HTIPARRSCVLLTGPPPRSPLFPRRASCSARSARAPCPRAAPSAWTAATRSRSSSPAPRRPRRPSRPTAADRPLPRGRGTPPRGEGAAPHGYRPGRVRRLAGRRFKPAATAQEGTRPGPHPGAASRGWGFKQAATVEGGAGAGVPVGCGVSRGRGSNRQQRRRKGRGRASGRARRLTGWGFKPAVTAEPGGGRASRPGAAPHGAGVQAGGDGGAGPGRRSPSRPARPTGGRVLYAGFNGGGAGSARLAVAADDVYQRVAPPQSPAPLRRSPSVAEQGPPRGVKATFRPSITPPRFPAPPVPAFRPVRTPDRRPEHPDQGPERPDPPQDARPHVTGATSRCAGHPTPPSLSVFTQVRGFPVIPDRPAPAPGPRGRDAPAPPSPRPGRRPRSRPRRRFEPPPRETPRPAGTPGPLALPLPPVWTSAPWGAALGWGPGRVPSCAVGAGLNPHPARRRA